MNTVIVRVKLFPKRQGKKTNVVKQGNDLLILIYIPSYNCFPLLLSEQQADVSVSHLFLLSDVFFI